jgi:hypothetical protein
MRRHRKQAGLLAVAALAVTAMLAALTIGAASATTVTSGYDTSNSTGTLGPAAPDDAITVNQMLNRGQDWVGDSVGYSQTQGWEDSATGGPYRTDCSGFISMAWGLSTSLTTETLPSVATVVDSNITGETNMQPGDALDYTADHAVLFVSWISKSAGTFYYDAEHQTGTVTSEMVGNLKSGYLEGFPISYFEDLRYNNILQTSTPSVAVSASGQASVFWQGLGTELEEAAGDANPDNGTLHRTDLGMGGLGSMPAAGDDANCYSYVFWAGTNDELFEAYYNGSKWVGPVGTGIAMGTRAQPTVAITHSPQSSAQAYVFWRGANGNLMEAQGAANPQDGALSGPYDRGYGDLGSVPAAGVDASGHAYVYWEGNDGNLYEGYYNGTGWVGDAVNQGFGTMGSAPTVAITDSPSASAQAYVFWRGLNGNLIEAQGDADPDYGSLSGVYDRGYGVLGSGPTAGIDSSGHTYVYWEGNDGDLWEGFYGGSNWETDAVNLGFGYL